MELIASFITTIVLLLYFYYTDRNKETPARLIEAFIIGAAISLQIDWLQKSILITPNIFFQAFIVAGLIEEGVKLLALRLTLFRHKAFEEKIDGITYAVFLSLGFATVENIILVDTIETGIVRAFTSVPAHALFGVAMGYYIGLYKFNIKNKSLLLSALLVPAGLHGLYNIFVMSEHPIGLLLFVPYVIFLWAKGLIKIKKLNRKVEDNHDQ